MKTLVTWLSFVLFGGLAGIAWFIAMMATIADADTAAVPAVIGAGLIWLATPLVAWLIVKRQRA